MATTFDALSSASQATSASLSWSHTCTGTNRILYVFAGGWDGTGRSATATYAGVSMTLAGTSALSNGADICWCFRLPAPATGANTIAVTITGGTIHAFGGGLSFAGAHQTTHDTPVSAVSSVNGTAISVNVTTSAVGDMIADACIVGATNTHVVNGPASHAEKWDISLVQGEASAGGVSDGAAGTVAVGWTTSASAGWAQVAVNVKAVVTAATLEQEGYRWRNDDGSETTATFAAAQDTTITLAASTTKRLRVIVNATNDPASANYKLQYRKVGDPSWKDIDKFQ